MIKIAICDDEQKDREKLQDFISGFSGIAIEDAWINEFESGEQLLSSGYNPDILFLDILMKEKDGIQVGEEIRRHNPDVLIIYITNLKEKISIAINRIHAFGYLEKPIACENVYTLLSDALNCLKQNARAGKVTFLSENKSIIELPPSDIYYFEYFQRKIKIVTKSKNYICKEKISEIANKMKSYGFEMCHQSFVVNLYEVEKIVPPNLIMKNGALVYLAQKRQSAIRKKIMQIARESTERGGSKA